MPNYNNDNRTCQSNCDAGSLDSVSQNPNYGFRDLSLNVDASDATPMAMDDVML